MSDITKSLFDVRNSTQRDFLLSRPLPWECVRDLSNHLARQAPLAIDAEVHPLAVIKGPVAIGPRTKIGPFAIIEGPAIIGADCFIGACLVRQSWIGNGSTIGYCSEVGRSIVLDGVVISHHCVVLDSVAGNRVKFGGSAKTANVRSDEAAVRVRIGQQKYATNLLKLGAIIGDDCRIAAGVVLMPGAVLGKGCRMLPGVHVAGWHPPGTQVRLVQSLQVTNGSLENVHCSV